MRPAHHQKKVSRPETLDKAFRLGLHPKSLQTNGTHAQENIRNVFTRKVTDRKWMMASSARPLPVHQERLERLGSILRPRERSDGGTTEWRERAAAAAAKIPRGSEKKESKFCRNLASLSLPPSLTTIHPFPAHPRPITP